MYRWPPSLPPTPCFVLSGATVPSCLVSDPPADAPVDGEGRVRVDIEVADGSIRTLASAGGTPADAQVPRIECDGNQVWPCFVDVHTHLDKGHIWPRSENPDGTFAGALAASASDRDARWTEADIAARMSFALEAAYAHGTVAIRTHLDSVPPLHDVAWSVFARLRDEWRGRIALQAATIVALDRLMGSYGDELADLVASHGGVLGGMPVPGSELDRQLDRVFGLAAARGLDLDFHADESGDVNARALEAIALAKQRHGFDGRVVVGHCCSLAMQPADMVERTLDVVAAAGIVIVSLPMSNLYLQDRVPARTPRWRGVTLLHEMHSRGIPIVLASDNCRDPFFGYGDHDMLEVFTQATRIAHLDRPVEPWPTAITCTPASVMGLAAAGCLRVGAPADLVLFNARGYSELLSRPQSDRLVLRAGRGIDTMPPCYRELDAVVAAPT